MDGALLARGAHRGGHRRGGSRTPLRGVVAERLPGRLRRRGGGGGAIGEALRVRVGTLPGHVERGEERFAVEWRTTDDSVWYEVFAFAHPAHPLAKVGRPFVRQSPSRFAADSLRDMAAAVEGGGER